MRLLSLRELASAPPRAWLVPGIIPLDGLVCLFGAPGTGKTFVALDLALTVAWGMEQWLGVAVPPRSPMGVVYVAAEGVAGLPARVSAWLSHANSASPTARQRCYGDEDVPIWFVGQALDLTDEQAVMAFAQAITARRERPAHPIGLVVIDTLARCAPGADENSAQEMGVVVRHLDLLRTVLGTCTVLLVHHNTRSSPNAMRGSSAVYGALETALSLVKDRHAALCLRTTKQKDGAAAAVHIQLLPYAESLVAAAAPPPPPPQAGGGALAIGGKRTRSE